MTDVLCRLDTFFGICYNYLKTSQSTGEINLKIKDMTKGSPTKLMLGFAIPVAITNLGQQFYQIADAAIVGRGIGAHALAAVGCTDWTYWVVLWSISAMTQGFATFVSRYFGKRDYKMMNKSITMSSLLALIVALIFTVLGIFLAEPILTLLKTPDDILPDAVTYLTTMLAGTVIVTGYNLTAAILRAFGDGRSPLTAMIAAAVMNILLDLVFIMVLQLGVFGAAIASVISQTAAFIICASRILKIGCVKLDREAWMPDMRVIIRLGTFAIPLAAQYVVINVGGMIVQSTVNLQGAAFIAGYTAVSKLYGILESTAISFGAAFTTFVSQNFGAGNFKRIRKSVATCIVLAITAALIIMAIVLPLSGILPQFFINKAEEGTAEALAVGTHYLINMTLFLPVLYLIYVYRSNFQSIGDSFWSMLSGFGESAVRILMAKLFIMWLGTNVLFFVEPFSWIAALLFVMVPYYICRGKTLPKNDIKNRIF